eukprot:gene4426-8539_t
MPKRFFAELRSAAIDAFIEIKASVHGHGLSAVQIARHVVMRTPQRLLDYVVGSFRFFWQNPNATRIELASGFTIAVLQIPESVAFSFVAGLDPVIGLRSSAFMGIVCGALGARPGMVSGAAGAMAVIVAQLSGAGGKWRQRPIDEVERLVFMTLILTGVFQCIIGMLGLARFSKLIPFTAMIGFINGLALIVLISQLAAFKECPGREYGECVRDGTLKWMSISDGRTWMGVVEVVLAALIAFLFPRLKHVERYIPAALVALVVVTGFEHGINRPFVNYPTRIVKETANVEGKFFPPTIPQLPDDTPWDEIIQYAIILAFVGVIETIITSDAVAEVLQEPNGPLASTQDSFAQGMGNFASGLFGGMGGDAMIGQSLINVVNGARYRLSTISSGIFLIIVIVALPAAIGLVPVTCLCGILMVIVFKTFHWNSFIYLFRLNWADSSTIVGVTILAVMTNLVIAVAVGIIWRALVHSAVSSQLLHVRSEIVAGFYDPEINVNSLQVCRNNDSKLPSGKSIELNYSGQDNVTQGHEVQHQYDSSINAVFSIHEQQPLDNMAEHTRKFDEPSQLQKSTESDRFMFEDDGKIKRRQSTNNDEAHVVSGTVCNELFAKVTNVQMPSRSGCTISRSRASLSSSSVEQEIKVYYVSGPLFFGSAATFQNAFSPKHDPKRIAIDFTECLVSDFSGVAAISTLCKKYRKCGKTIKIYGIGTRSQSHLRRQPSVQHFMDYSRDVSGVENRIGPPLPVAKTRSHVSCHNPSAVPALSPYHHSVQNQYNPVALTVDSQQQQQQQSNGFWDTVDQLELLRLPREELSRHNRRLSATDVVSLLRDAGADIYMGNDNTNIITETAYPTSHHTQDVFFV